MTHSRLAAILAGAFLLTNGVAFYAGRRSAPARVETRTEYRDRVVTVQAQQKATQHEEAHAGSTTTTTRTVYRDGPVRYVTRIERAEDSTSRRDAAASATVTATEHATERVEARTVVTAARWAVGASVGVRVPDLSARPERVSLDVARRLFGSLWVTAGVSATPTLGAPLASAGLRVSW